MTQTTIVIDFPEETAQPARKPKHPFTLLEKLLLKAANVERDPTPRTTEERFHGNFLTQ